MSSMSRVFFNPTEKSYRHGSNFKTPTSMTFKIITGNVKPNGYMENSDMENQRSNIKRQNLRLIIENQNKFKREYNFKILYCQI